MSFNWEVYNLLYPDLAAAGLNTPNKLQEHWLKWGKTEGRMCCIAQACPEFNHEFYRNNYPDLAHMDNRQLELHWLQWGKDEGRKFSIIGLYPGFNHDIYRINYPDLADMNNSQLETHWVQWGRKEGRTFTLNSFNGKYPEFDLKYYRDFNSELNGLSEDNLKLDYIKTGRNNNNAFLNYRYNVSDYSKNEFVSNSDFNNRAPMYKITRKEELINVYPRKLYICNKEQFDIYYSGFDSQYYRNKYFNGKDISDYDMMKYHSTIGKNNGNSINNRVKIVIYTPPLDINCGGIIAIHNMAKTLNELNMQTKLYVYNGITYNNIFCTNFAHIDEIDDNTIVIYPETVGGNPLGATRVVRWILLELGIEMPLDHWKKWGVNDLVYYWEPKKGSKQLCLNWYNPIFTNNNINGPRNNTCYLIKKGRLIHKNINYIHPQNSICLDDIHDLQYISNIFNQCKYFYCYDPNSSFTLFAASCGCIPIVYPISGLNAEEYFKARMYNYEGTIYNKGIVYGNNRNDINRASMEINSLGDYYPRLFDMYKNTVVSFISGINQYNQLTNRVGNIYH
jgi:hypothetical protein